MGMKGNFIRPNKEINEAGNHQPSLYQTSKSSMQTTPTAPLLRKSTTILLRNTE